MKAKGTSCKILSRLRVGLCRTLLAVAVLAVACSETDPVRPGSTEPAWSAWNDYALIPIDTFLVLTNREMSAVQGDLNGFGFTAIADSLGASVSDTLFFLPSNGTLAVHIGARMDSAGNVLRLRSRGPAGARVDVLVADLLPPGVTVAGYLP